MAPHFDSTATLSGTPLTIGWIEEIVKKSTQEGKHRLVDWSAEKIGVGQGFCSHIFRVHLTWDKDSDNSHHLPRSVVVKVPTPVKIMDGLDEVAKDGNMTSMNDEDKGKIEDLWLPIAHSNETVALKFLNSLDDKFAIPKLHVAQEYRKDEIGHGCLVMEDFVHGAPPNIVVGLSKDQLTQVSCSLAAIQAASMDDNDNLSKLVSMQEEFIRGFSTMAKGIGEQFQMMAPDFGFDELFPKMTWIFEEETLLPIMNYPKEKGLPNVLTHGDLWASNMLVRKNVEGKPTGDLLSLIDWQTAHAGFVTEDLGRVLVTSTTGELRRQETDNVLHTYFDEFQKKLAKSGKECSLIFEMIKDAYDFNFPFAVAFFVMMVPIMMTSPAFTDDTGKPAAHCLQSIMLRAKMAMEDALELRKMGRC